mgnify:CR=1 FL=1
MITKKIGDIAIKNNAVTISKEAKTKVLVNIFNLSKVQSIVILDGKKAIGLVMKDKFLIGIPIWNRLQDNKLITYNFLNIII